MALTFGVVLTWAAVVSLAAVFGIMCCFCSFGVAEVTVRHCLYCRGLAQLQLWPRSAYVAASDGEVPQAWGDEKMYLRWVGEATLMLMLPWVACAGSILLGHFAGAGWPMLTVYGLIVPFLIRVKAWESHDVARLEQIWPRRQMERMEQTEQTDGSQNHTWYSLVVDELRALCRLHATLGCLEVLDAVSDGAAVASAWLLDTRSTQHFHTAWQATPLIGPLAAGLGPVGCMAAALAFASVCQLGAAGDSEAGDERDTAVAAEVAGAGALAQRLISRYEEAHPGSRGGTTFAVFMARVLGENAPQLLLQTSIIAAQGKGVLHDPVLVVSICLSWGTMLKKYCELWCQNDMVVGVFCGILGLPIPMMLTYIAAKLYFIERCASHEWGMSTGCVQF